MVVFEMQYRVQGNGCYNLAFQTLIQLPQVDLKDKWRNLAHAVVYKKQTRRVWLTDEQKERIIKCLPQYNPELPPLDQQAVVPPPDGLPQADQPAPET